MSARIAKIAALCCLLSAFGCAPTLQGAAKELAKGAAPAAIDEGLKALDEPRTRARIAELLASPEVQKAIRDLAGAATEGVTQALSDAQLANRTAELGKGIAALATRAAVDAALDQSTSPANQRRLQQMAAAAADSAVRGALRAFAEELPTTVGPALRESLRRDVAASVPALLNAPEVRSALAQSVYEIARQTVLGSNAGLAELEQRSSKKGALARLAGFVANGGWVLACGLLVLVGTLSAFIVLFRRTRTSAPARSTRPARFAQRLRTVRP